MRGMLALSAMIVGLATGWLIIRPQPAAGQVDPLRLVLSLVLLFGIAFLGGAVAMVLHERLAHRRGGS